MILNARPAAASLYKSASSSFAVRVSVVSKGPSSGPPIVSEVCPESEDESIFIEIKFWVGALDPISWIELADVEGPVVTIELGDLEGSVDGIELGELEGSVDGVKLGVSEALVDGIKLGELEGSVDGVKLGVAEGSVDGIGLG